MTAENLQELDFYRNPSTGKIVAKDPSTGDLYAVPFEDVDLETMELTQEDLTSDSSNPSSRGVVKTHDGSGTPPAGLYESDPDNSQWSGVGLASGNTISY